MQLISKVAVSAAKLEILAEGRPWWNKPAWRTMMPSSPHRQAEDILLRFQELRRDQDERPLSDRLDDLESVSMPPWWKLSEVRALVYRLHRTMWASRIGRVVVTKLSPGKSITPHVDTGQNAAYYDRFQVCIGANTGCVFTCGGVRRTFSPGEIWWFDNRLEHSVVNDGKSDRLTLIIDLRVEDFGDGWRDTPASGHRLAQASA